MHRLTAEKTQPGPRLVPPPGRWLLVVMRTGHTFSWGLSDQHELPDTQILA